MVQVYTHIDLVLLVFMKCGTFVQNQHLLWKAHEKQQKQLIQNTSLISTFIIEYPVGPFIDHLVVTQWIMYV